MNTKFEKVVSNNDSSSLEGSIDEKMTLVEFIKAVEMGFFVDDDGYGEYATESGPTGKFVGPSDYFKGKLEYEYPYVIWYNK